MEETAQIFTSMSIQTGYIIWGYFYCHFIEGKIRCNLSRHVHAQYVQKNMRPHVTMKKMKNPHAKMKNVSSG